ncbi:Tryprostatin B 6-hydroxylase [Fusarium oxysporum]|nr:averantin oxidoreductase [Fusarium oxysporum Fo47]QKD61328.2 averantin oxidoreductase [Fusarium oxysporum Fo47]RKK34357.1 Tryprostatin B 6-hydroxylase [Fusarium oxysporum f. sp. cepae]RKK35331.1 Tryprostatin B 6-hydroxylase [Fusarium oxysporum f. sp. cepae]RKL23379.1 Tryprostatin B 6-hydroxylase [Fusarium oxysporum]
MMNLSAIQLDSLPVLVVVAFCGVATHLAIFRIGEWDVAVHRIIAFFGLIYALIFTLIAYHRDLDHQSLLSAWYTASALLATFIAGIYGSMVIFRFFFHALRRFPGPTFAPISSLYAVSMSMKKFHMFSEMQKLHNTYGDFVRLGPSEMSIASPSAVAAIYQNSSPCLKGPWYNVFVPSISLHASRDKQEHAHRRKVWDRGLSAKAMRDYEPRVEKYTRLLISQLQKRCGKPVDIAEWCNFYGFDVMGDLAFGKSFNMLNDGVRHYYMDLTQTSTLWGTQIARSSWLYLLIKSIPILNYQIANFLKWLRTHVDQRAKNEPDLPDLFSWLLGAYKEQSVHTKQDELNLLGDAHLIVVAGSDTTSTSLTCALFELARHPDVYRKLRTEVDDLLKPEDTHSHSALAKLKYLQAVIDETMRLYPAIPSGLQRITPPQGLHINGTFIPGNMIVQTPTYTLNRDERCFVRPNNFIPERWTTQPELVRDASAFAPFSIGRYSCAGKQLGLFEIRHVLSHIVSKFDLRFAPDQTSELFQDGLADGFTLLCPKLEMIFETRKNGELPS